MEKTFIRTCIEKWRWFVASVATTLVIAILFLLVYAPRYERTATILVKDESGGAGLISSIAANMGMLSGLGLGMLNISSNVSNEMEIIGSPAMVMKVVDRMALDVRYEYYDFIMKRELWDETLPVKVTFPQLTEKDGGYMKMDLKKDGSFTLYKFRKNKDKLDGEVSGKVGEVCQTPIGKVSVIKTKHFDRCFSEDDEQTIRITKERKYDQVERCLKQLEIDLADDQTSIISLTYKDQNSDRAETILNTLIQVYEEEWQKDKVSDAAISTNFINERIQGIEQELSGLDTNIAQFRGKNLLPDYEEAAKMYMKNATLTYEAQLKVNNYLYMMEQMRSQVKSIEGKNVVLPANLLPDNPNVALEIAEYNKLQTKRNAMAANSNDQNPLVQDLDVQLKGMREAIVNSLDQGIAQLKAQQRGVNIDDQKLKGEMAAAPGKITKILPAERKQKIIEALYIYLLEKREENNITQVFNAKNIRLVSPPLGKLKPVFPKKGVTILLSLLLGMIIPMLVIYTRRNMKAILAEE
jgi:uncharacterized protein involved in exopolysaccharide biosynthesis